MAISMDRSETEADGALRDAAAAAGLSLRAIHGRCGWAFTHDEVAECAEFETRSTASQGLGGFAARRFVRGECVLTEQPLLHWKVAKGDAITHEGVEALLATLSSRYRVNRPRLVVSCAVLCVVAYVVHSCHAGRAAPSTRPPEAAADEDALLKSLLQVRPRLARPFSCWLLQHPAARAARSCCWRWHGLRARMCSHRMWYAGTRH